MKKIIFIILFIAIPFLADAQLSGSGTFADPWSGTLAGDAIWSGTKYINGDITVDNEKLTISAGSIIIFLSESADLIITGTGQLETNGTTGSMIRFTSDDDNDGSYGETGERWGHIYFNAPSESNQSIIDYCIIEYGDVHTFSDYQGYGGAIYSKFSNLIVSNSIIRNNYGDWGGGIFVGSGQNPTISKCLFYNNKSDHGGGAVYCWNSSSSLIENCIFDSNQCLEPSVEYYTGGGLAGQTGCSIKVINCTFVNNTSTRPEGQGLLLHSSGNSLVINSIFWGSSDKQIYNKNTAAGVIINCAYRGITYSSGSPVSPVVLNSSNSASDGPNFVATDGSNWSIKFVSPCRDAGTTPSPTVPNDYIGNSRIYNYDIGAYEVQYSRWKTTASSADWGTDANWYGGVPTNTRDVVIPTGATNYPTASPTTQDFTIGSGKQMIIEQGARVTLDDLTNNGTLKMFATSSGLSSLIMNSYSRGTGATEDIQLYLTGGYIDDPENQEGRWHYISSPIDNLSRNIFTVNTLDLAQWIDGMQGQGSIREGWVAFDGWIYLADPPSSSGPTFDYLDLGKGYNFWDDLASNTYSLSGLLNTSDVNVTLDFAGQDYENGFNLLGNPFTSGLDWDYILENTEYPENASQGIYFTKDNIQYSYISGVLVPEDGEPAPSGVIPPMQGFFVKTYEDNVQINLTAAARTHNDIPARYKGKSSIPLLRLGITDNGSSDETVVRFAEKALTGIDMGYDALKMFIPETKTAIYTSIPGKKMSINGQPFLEPQTFIEIPVTVNVSSNGNHTISAKQLQGLDEYKLTLTDNSTGFSANLKTTSDLTFSASAGLIANRFILKIKNIIPCVEDPISTAGKFNIFHGFGLINIQTITDEWDGKSGSVKILDMAGKTMSDLQNTEFRKSSVIQIQAPATNGLYFVEIRAGVNRYVGKVVIK